MKRILTLAYSLLILLIITSSAKGIKPQYNIDTHKITSKYANVSFKKIETFDHYKLLLADIKPTKAKPKNIAILICYPDSGNIEKWLGYGMVLADMGYNAIMFDYRGFGGSDYFKTAKDTLYRQEYLTDANAAYNYLCKQYPNHRHGLFGLSMGSILTSELASNFKGDFVIGDAYVADMDSTVANIEKAFGRTLERPSSSLEYNENVQYIRQPMLIFAGKYSNTISSDGLVELNPLSEKVTYQGGYLEGPMVLKQAYFNKIDQFITKVVNAESQEASTGSYGTLIWIILGIALFSLPPILLHRHYAKI